jgi:hypothetical protein
LLQQHDRGNRVLDSAGKRPSKEYSREGGF